MRIDGGRHTLTELVARKLVDRYDLDLPPNEMTMGEAAAAFLRQRGRDEDERLYRVVNDIINKLGDQPCAPLCELAAITDLSLFVSTTPDRWLANAVNGVRFGSWPHARELSFSPAQSTGEQARNQHAPSETETTVVRLFGAAASTPQYAVHDEDRLEWLHALLSGGGSLPEWLAHALKERPLLFIGCDMPDWMGRFLLRLSSSKRIWLENKQFFFVGRSTAAEPSLARFFSTYCRRTQVQHLQMAPEEFVSQLRRRSDTHPTPDSRSSPTGLAPRRTSTGSAIFISYLREDIDHARRLSAHITELGGEAWLDERRLWPGDSWGDEILQAIRRRIRLFLPIVSTNTEQEDEGYVFREWWEAVERAHTIPRRRFIIPVVVDDPQGDPSTYQQIPEEFRRYNFAYAPTGKPDAHLRSMLVEEIRAMRRVGAP